MCTFLQSLLKSMWVSWSQSPYLVPAARPYPCVWLSVCLSVHPSHSSLSCPATVCDFAKSRDVLLGAKTFYLSAYTQTYICIYACVCVCIICIRLCVYGMCIKLCICVYLRLVSGKPKRFKSACPKAFSSPTWPRPLCAPAVDCAKLRRSLTFGIKRIRCVCEKNKQKKLQRRQQQQHYARVC